MKPFIAFHAARMLFTTLALTTLCAGGSAMAQTVSVDNEAGSAFKGAKRVVISQFGVEFYTQLVAIGRAGGNTATQTTTLVGVSDATLQGVVDKLYAETVDKLKAAGFEVVDAADLVAEPQYQALVKAYGKPSPYVVRDSQGLGDGEHLSKVLARSGQPAFYASAGSSGGYLRANLSDRLDSQNYGIGTREAELAKKLEATLLKFSFLANYGITKASKNGLLATFAQTAARVSIETAPVLMAFDSQVQFVNAAGPRAFGNVKRSGQSGAFYLDKPLQGDNIFSIVETAPAAGAKDDSVTNAIFGLLGSGKAVKTQAAQVTAEEAAYLAAYAKLLATAEDALIEALRAAR